MPDAVLESQLGTLSASSDAENETSVLAGPEVARRRSAVFVDLYDTARYGTRLIH